MKRNPWNLVTVVLFALLLLAVPLAFLLLPYRTFSDAERRYLADAPKLGEQDLSDWSYDDKVETFPRFPLHRKDSSVRCFLV